MRLFALLLLAVGAVPFAPAQDPWVEPELSPVPEEEPPIRPLPAPSLEELEPLVLVGTKLDSTISQAMASVGRLDGDRLDTAEIRDLNGAYRLLANVRAPQFVDGGFVIRGINSEAPDAENISGDQTPLSTIYVDGVALTQQAARRGPTGVWDVESVEVYRGPQSTVQGKNALAGSVVIQTKDPVFFLEGASRVTYGNFSRQEIATMLNLPVSDFLALRLTYERSERRGFVDYPNLVDFSKFEDFRSANFEQYRGKVLLEPEGGRFRSVLTFAYSDSSPALSDVFGPNAPVPFRDPAIEPVEDFFDRDWLNDSGATQMRDLVTRSFSLDAQYEINDHLRLNLLSTYIDTSLGVRTINDDFLRTDEEREFTQEVRANWENDWSKAVLGVFSSDLSVESTQNAIERTRTNQAIFGEAEVRVWAGLHLIGGGRLFEESVDFESTPLGVTNTARSDESGALPKVGARYDFAPEHTLGFTFQNGYQSGGSGIDGTEVYEFDPSSTDHYEVAYRLALFDQRVRLAANAFYADWTDQQVVLRTFDLTTFSPSERVINAAESQMWGGEVEISIEPIENLTLFASLGFLATQYQEFRFEIDPAITQFLPLPGELDYQGYDFPESPPFNGSVGFSWKPAKGFFLAGDASYTESYYSPVLFASTSATGLNLPIQVPQNDLVKVPSFLTVNLSCGYQAENWTLSFFVENLLEKDYLIGKVPGVEFSFFEGVSFQDDFLATVGPPRTYGIALEVRF
ncbi:MAG: TonB-dependent receptor [Verrucomicrobiota bacterium]